MKRIIDSYNSKVSAGLIVAGLMLFGLPGNVLVAQAIRPGGGEFRSVDVDQRQAARYKQAARPTATAQAARSESAVSAQDTASLEASKAELLLSTPPAVAASVGSLGESSKGLDSPDAVSSPRADEIVKLIVPKPSERKAAAVQGTLDDPLSQKLSDAGVGENTYRIGVGDVVGINVWREPEVSVAAMTVRTDGKITLPLVKEVHVLGLTPRELEWLLTRAFSQFIRTPDVTVMINEIRSQKVYLVGGVNKPGSMELKAPITVLQALAEAGGLTQFAKKNKITVLRQEGDEKLRLTFEYDAVMKGEEPSQNILLRPGDTIVVPE